GSPSSCGGQHEQDPQGQNLAGAVPRRGRAPQELRGPQERPRLPARRRAVAGGVQPAERGADRPQPAGRHRLRAARRRVWPAGHRAGLRRPGDQPVNETRIARSLISAQSGFNTRRHFDAAALESLAESIRQQGVIQPLLLRPRTDGEQGFWIVCGERRWRAAGIAGLDDMPAMVRPMTDREAFLAAMHENKEREDLTPAEEALSARRAVDACDGNEGEAAKVLGWTRDRLRARLLLVHALPEVLDAAAEKRIALGHAELLATLPETLQKTVFAKVLQHGISVDELKRQMAAFTQDLGAATFNTAGCNGCVNNSSTQ